MQILEMKFKVVYEISFVGKTNKEPTKNFLFRTFRERKILDLKV
jgi:hypothetical protein